MNNQFDENARSELENIAALLGTNLKQILNEELKAVEKRFEERFSDLQVHIKKLDEATKRIRKLEKRIDRQSDELDMQKRYIGSRERFPTYPQDIRPSSARRSIETHSCSKPETRKVGYTG